MARLPNEILDEIWSERCKLGFEPRILQAKWINVGHMRLPAFYVAQPQAFMTQLCHGAREVAAKGFYSRVFDNPFTGNGGFWWNGDDVLYIDREFYHELHPSRKALVLGRDKITHVALDIEIDRDSITIMELIVDWFPNLSQVFFTDSTRFFSYNDSVAGGGPQSEPSESAIAKSFPINTFCRTYGPKDAIPGDLSIRVQGLTGLLNELVPAEDRARFLEIMHNRYDYIRLYVFNRSDTRSTLDPNGSPSEDGNFYSFPLTLKDVEHEIESDASHDLMCNIRDLGWWNTDSEEKTHMNEDNASINSRDDEYSHDESFYDENFRDENFRDENFHDENFHDENFHDENFHDENFHDETFHDWSYDETFHNVSDDTYLYEGLSPPFWQQNSR